MTFRVLFLLALSLVATLPVVAQKVVARNYTRAHGLVSNYILCLYQDRAGFIWIGTDRGVSRYDGKEFKTYTTSDGLPGNFIYSIFQDSRGRMWFGTFENGAASFDGKRWTYYKPGSEPGDLNARGFTEDRLGRVYIHTPRGIHIAHKGVLASFPFERQSGSVLQSLSNGSVIFADGGGLRIARPTDDTLLVTLQVRGIPAGESIVNSRTLATHADGDTLYLSSRSRIIRYTLSEDGSVTSWRSVGLLGTDAWSITMDRNRQILAAHELGVTVFGKEDSRKIGVAEGIQPEYVRALLRDSEGTIWLGSFGGGLYKMAGDHLTLFDEFGSGAPRSVSGLYQDSQGTLWAGNGTHLIAIKENELVATPLSKVFQRSAPRLFFEDRDGKMFAGTFTGLYVADSPASLPAQNLKLVFEHPSGVSSLARDLDGALWISTYGSGVYRSIGDTATSFSTKDGLCSDNIEEIVAGDSSLWFLSYSDGATRYKDGVFSTLNTGSGLPSDKVFALLEDDDETVWIGTDKGLTRVAGNDFITLGEREGLFGYLALSIFRPSDSTGCPLYIVTDKALHCFKDGILTHFGSVPLLPSGPVSINRVHYNKTNKTLWLATTSGIVKVDLRAMERERRLFSSMDTPVRIMEMAVNDSVLFTSGIVPDAAPPKLHFASDQNNISIRFATLLFSNEDFVRYQVRLSPADKEWSVPTASRAILYRNLSDGDYTFEVVGINADGVASTQPARIAFTIAPPFWKTTWFFFAGGFLLAGLIALAIRAVALQKIGRNIAELKRQEDLVLEREKTRARIARDLHDDIASALGSISLYAASLKKRLRSRSAEKNSMLERISELSLESIEAMDDIIWSIAPQNDTLKGLLYRLRSLAEESLTIGGISFTFTMPEQYDDCVLEGNIRRHLYLIVKEALRNVIRHSEAQNVSIVVSVEGGLLAIRIVDDGRGFKVPDERAADAQDLHGIGNMRTRARDINAILTIESVFNKGTEITLLKDLR